MQNISDDSNKKENTDEDNKERKKPKTVKKSEQIIPSKDTGISSEISRKQAVKRSKTENSVPPESDRVEGKGATGDFSKISKEPPLKRAKKDSSTVSKDAAQEATIDENPQVPVKTDRTSKSSKSTTVQSEKGAPKKPKKEKEVKPPLPGGSGNSKPSKKLKDTHQKENIEENRNGDGVSEKPKKDNKRKLKEGTKSDTKKVKTGNSAKGGYQCQLRNRTVNSVEDADTSNPYQSNSEYQEGETEDEGFNAMYVPRFLQVLMNSRITGNHALNLRKSGFAENALRDSHRRPFWTSITTTTTHRSPNSLCVNHVIKTSP